MVCLRSHNRKSAACLIFHLTDYVPHVRFCGVRDAMERVECVVHLEEPCGDGCSESCAAAWHHKRVVRGTDVPLCQECFDENARQNSADLAYQSGYAYACGYRD